MYKYLFGGELRTTLLN